MATKKNNITPTVNPQDKALNLFADMMIKRIEDMKNSNWSKPWFCEGAMSGAAVNLDGREYNGMNQFMLSLYCMDKGFQYPVFVTCERVNALNWEKDKQGESKRAVGKDGKKLPVVHILKGSKSFPVFITTMSAVNKQTNERIKWSEYSQLGEEARKDYNTYRNNRVFYVFNIAETNIKEARPELWAKVTDKYSIEKPVVKTAGFTFPAVDKMIADNLWICPIKPTHGDSAYFAPSTNVIVVPEYSQFKDGESFYSNLFHEMAHSTGHVDHLNRLKAGDKEAYAKEELIAEMTAALVSSRYGIEKHINDDSAAYLKSWLGSLKQDPQFIKTVLLDVKKAAYMLNDVIDHTAEQINASAAA